MKSLFLSYTISGVLPVYGGLITVSIDQVKSIDRGDFSNVFSFILQNHWGTHVDCPAHFFQDGMKVTDYDADFWFFVNPQIVPVDAIPGQIISQNDLKEDVRDDTDLLILRSGWGKYRNDPVYYQRNPGVDPDLGFLLRRKYPSVRAVAIDWISLSSYEHREIGRSAHRAFLDPSGQGDPILVIEDMYLPEDLRRLNSVYVAPLRIAEIDSAPCTIIGFL